MRILLPLVVVLAVAAPATAEIAIFTDGRSLKVDAYQVSADTIELTLAAGGKVTVPLVRLERVVDDEIVPVEEVKAIVREGVFPVRSWRFSETSRPLFESRFNATIIAAARHFDVDAALVSAVIKAESDYDPRIVSHKGARGLMQLMPATAKRFGVHDAFDPTANIYAGTRYLRWLLKTFDGNADLAVAAYNAGEGNVWKYNGVPPFRETVTYIKRIARHFPAAESVTVSLAGSG